MTRGDAADTILGPWAGARRLLRHPLTWALVLDVVAGALYATGRDGFWSFLLALLGGWAVGYWFVVGTY
ncbi:MAG: hypothetical protein ACK5MP_12150, partial [Nostocoides sp.]